MENFVAFSFLVYPFSPQAATSSIAAALGWVFGLQAYEERPDALNSSALRAVATLPLPITTACVRNHSDFGAE